MTWIFIFIVGLVILVNISLQAIDGIKEGIFSIIHNIQKLRNSYKIKSELEIKK